jgi:rsbT co-antagonist protein RsbR
MEKSPKISDTKLLPQLLAKHEDKVLDDWTALLAKDHSSSRSTVREDDLKQQAREFLPAVREGLQLDEGADLAAPAWERTRGVLAELSRKQADQGATPSEVASFVFSLKGVLFGLLQSELAKNPEVLAREILNASLVLDRLGLFTVEIALKSRAEVISRQQMEMLELSTPVVKLWEGILALPLIGTLDSERTQIVMENLLEEIVKTGAGIAIIDITGVPTVDTLVAQHLLKTVAAARLMGAECIISGIRPQIASTIVHLGVDLGGVATKATLADAFALALRRSNQNVAKAEPSTKGVA